MEILSTFHARVKYISGENSLFLLLPLLRYNLASSNSLLLQATKPKHQTDMVYNFVHFSSTSISILNLTMSSESQESDVSNDILVVCLLPVQGHAVQGHAVQGHAVQGHAVQGHAVQAQRRSSTTRVKHMRVKNIWVKNIRFKTMQVKTNAGQAHAGQAHAGQAHAGQAHAG